MRTVRTSGLTKRCDSLESHCTDYIENIVSIDDGIDALLETVGLLEEFGAATDPSKQLSELHNSTIVLINATDEPFSQIDYVRLMMRQFSKLSRALKTPCMRIDAALDRVTSSRVIFEGWELKLHDYLASIDTR